MFTVGVQRAIGTVAISIIVLVGFFLAFGMLMFVQFPAESADMLKIMVGFLGGMAVTVVSYWVGSSFSSHAKDDVQAQSAQAKDDTIKTLAAEVKTGG